MDTGPLFISDAANNGNIFCLDLFIPLEEAGTFQRDGNKKVRHGCICIIKMGAVPMSRLD